MNRKESTTCTACNATKLAFEFPTRGNICKTCVAVRHKAYRAVNAERIAAKKLEWKLANMDHVKRRDAAWAAANPDKRRKARNKWSSNNPDADREAKTKWVKNNPDKRAQVVRAWGAANLDIRRTTYATRRAKKKNSIPAWADRFFMQEAYALAVLRTQVTGVAWEVDHIVPLVSKLVCGLHCIDNMQVIPATLNRRKSNVVWPDMPMGRVR